MAKISATLAISIICVAASIFAWASPNTDQLVDTYGYSTNNLLAGNAYVLFTSIFLHADFAHLASNLLVFLIFGLVLEKEIGGARFMGLFFAGSITGDLLSSLVYSPAVPSIGASAGIFAIVAATMLIKPVPMEGIPIPLGVIAIGYILYAIIGLLTNTPPHVSQMGHLGGALVGLIYGCKRKGLKSAFKILAAVTILLLLLPAIWEVWAMIVNFTLGSIAAGG